MSHIYIYITENNIVAANRPLAAGQLGSFHLGSYVPLPTAVQVTVPVASPPLWNTVDMPLEERGFESVTAKDASCFTVKEIRKMLRWTTSWRRRDFGWRFEQIFGKDLGGELEVTVPLICLGDSVFLIWHSKMLQFINGLPTIPV